MRILILLLAALPALAENLMLSDADVTRLRADVASNTTRWQTLKAVCDTQYVQPVQDLGPSMIDETYSEYNSNGPFPYGGTTIKGGYEGGDLKTALQSLAACYLATIDNVGFADQTRAAAYGAKAKDILKTITRPAAEMRRSMGAPTITVSGGTASVSGVTHSYTTGQYFVVEIAGTSSTILNAKQRAIATSTTAFSFPTTEANGTYAPSNINSFITTDAEQRAFTILRVVAGNPTRLDMQSGSLFKNGQQVVVRGLPAPYDVLNGTHTASSSGGGTLNTILRLDVDTSALSNSTNIMIGAEAAPTEEAFSVTAFTAGNPSRLTLSGASLRVGQRIRVWGLPSPCNVLNGEWIAHTGSTGTTLYLDYDSSAVGACTTTGAFAGDYTRLTLTFQGTLNGLAVGQDWTVSGVRGCTEANATWRILTLTKPLKVTYTNGDPAPAIAGTCDHNGPRVSSDAGYHLRNLIPAIAIGYEWLYPLLTSDERTAARAKIEEQFWVSADVTVAPNFIHPMSNYYTASNYGFQLARIAMVDLHNESLPTYIRDYIDSRRDLMFTYFNAWLSNGGYPQGLRDYGNAEIGNIYREALAEYHVGRDWRNAPYNFAWLGGTLDYFLGMSAPDGVQSEDWGYVSTLGGVQSPQDTRISAEATLGIAAWANAVGHAKAAKFSKFHHDTLAAVQAAAAIYLPAYSNAFQAGVRSLPAWDFVLEQDWTEEAWQPTDLTYYAFTGDYAISRTDWSSNAAYLTFYANQFTDYAPQGKSKMKLGEVTIRRGGAKRLVGTADGFVARTQAKGGVDALHNSNAYTNQTYMRNNRYYNGLWAAASGKTQGGTQNYQNWCVPGASINSPLRTIPNYDPTVLSLAAGDQPKLTATTDQATFSAWTAEYLECYYTYASTVPSPAGDSANHVQSWKRDVTFFRPSGIAVVRDRTQVFNATDERFIMWQVPDGGSIGDVAAGKQFTVSNVLLGGDVGAITFVSPSGLVATRVDTVHPDGVTAWGSVWDRVEIRPSAMDHTTDTFITVLDPSGDLTNVGDVTNLSATNATAIEVGDDGLVVYATGTLPLTYTLATAVTRTHVVKGLAASSSINVEISGSTVTIGGAGGSPVSTDASGLMHFQGGGAGGDITLYRTPATLTFNAIEGGADPASQSFVASAFGGTPEWAVSDDQSWCSATPTSFTSANQTVTVSVVTGALTAASSPYTCTVTLSSATSGVTNSPVTVTVTFNVAAEPPVVPELDVDFDATSLDLNGACAGTVSATGGTAPYTYSIVSGSVPGCSLSTDTLIGTTTTLGNHSIVFRATDSADPAQTADIAAVVRVRATESGQIEARVLASSTSALVRLRRSGLDANTAGTIIAVNNAGDIVAQSTVAAGPASRAVVLTGLTPSTTYTLHYQFSTVQGSQVFDTPSASSTNASVIYQVSSSTVAGTTHMRLRYGGTSALGSTSSVTACSGGVCQITLTRDSGPLWIADDRCSDDACNTVLASHPARPFMVQ